MKELTDKDREVLLKVACAVMNASKREQGVYKLNAEKLDLPLSNEEMLILSRAAIRL